MVNRVNEHFRDSTAESTEPMDTEDATPIIRGGQGRTSDDFTGAALLFVVSAIGALTVLVVFGAIAYVAKIVVNQ